MLTEVPLSYPCHSYSPRVYVIDANDGTIRQSTSVDATRNSTTPTKGGAATGADSTPTRSPLPLSPYYSGSMSSSSSLLSRLHVRDDALPGSASVSTLDIGGRDAILTTSGLVGTPEVLNVSLSWWNKTATAGRGGTGEPTMIQLDLKELLEHQQGASGSPLLTMSSNRTMLQQIVKVEAFTQSSSGVIRLVIIDNQATILTVPLTVNNDILTPLVGTTCQIMTVSNYLIDVDETIKEEIISTSDLQSTMIGFVSSSVVCMALTPYVVTVDLVSQSCVVWNEKQCREEMKSRLSSFSSYFTLGRDAEILPTPPTAALCVTSTPSPLLDPIFVFTLHSDSSIRKWKLDPTSSLNPLDVETIEATSTSAALSISNQLPVPTAWSDTRNSVSICARLYQRVYALTVHIKTIGSPFGASSSGRGGDNGSSAAEEMSDCHLWVVSGPQSTSNNYNEVPTICKTLQVPKDAYCMVGMSFLPTVQRCTLGVLFQSFEDNDRTVTIQLTYPPSNVESILSTVPVVSKFEGSLDEVATVERSRIRALLYGNDILRESFEENNTTVEEDLHKLDTMYMKYLFRPIYPRGTGTVLGPSEQSVQRAISRLVPNSAARQKDEAATGIELKTLRAMYDWRSRENRRLFAMTPLRNDRHAPSTPVAPGTDMAVAGERTMVPAQTPNTPYAVYEQFVQGGDDDDDMSVEDPTNDIDNSEELDRERESQIEDHENRWRQLLEQVWEEEAVLRFPVCVSWMNDIKAQVIVRGAATTVVDYGEPSQARKADDSAWEIFDTAAMGLLERIENDKRKAKELYLIEQAVAKTVSKSMLAIEPSDQCNGFIEGLTELGQWAWAEVDDASSPEGIADSQHAKLEEAMSSLSVDKLVQWVQSTPLDSSIELVGLNQIKSVGTENSSMTSQDAWHQHQVANCQVRHAACSLSIRCIDSVRRLHLSRCLLLLDLVEGRHATEAALRSYLHSMAIMWAAAQRTPMPFTAFKARRIEKVKLDGTSPDSMSPPVKRLSFGDDTSSILTPASTSTTTSMDTMMISITQNLQTAAFSSTSPVDEAVRYSKLFFRAAFPAFDNNGVKLSKPCQLPELGALPSPNDDRRVTDYPRIALRLLSPFVAFPLPKESKDMVRARKEALAECLLIESHADSSDSAVQLKMRHRACDLLVPEGFNNESPISQSTIQDAVDALNALMRAAPNCSNSNLDSLLPATMQKIIYGDASQGVSVEIKRLCDMETVRRMFSPFVAGLGTDLDGVTSARVKSFANTLLHLSRLMHRLTTLERHVGGSSSNGSSSDMLLDFIVHAVQEMKTRFPGDFCKTMPEYVNLWSRLFSHAVNAEHWEQAYSACISNPVLDHRERNSKRLVRAMVDAGALMELLDKCMALSRSSEDSAGGNGIDLYELASEVLADAVSHDVYTVRASSPKPSTLSDYQGALYALHVSQKQWRRAAQSMDQRFFNARKALGSVAIDFSHNLGAAVLRDGLIVEDLVLAAVSSLNAIELVPDKAHRFVVSGELGPFNTVPIDGPEDPRAIDYGKKRTRVSFQNESPIDGSRDEQDRLSNFLSALELHGRAIRSISLRNLFFDGSSDPSYAKASFLRDVDSSESDIDELFKNGYFRYGLLLAKAMSKNYEALTGSCQPEGEDLFYLSLNHMLSNYVVPVAIDGKVTLESPEGALVTLARPSLPQILSSLDEVDSAQASFVSSMRSKKLSGLQSAAASAAAMALLRKLTVAHSTAATPVALEVASFFLANSQNVPAWLERTLMGADAPLSKASNGLFARRPEKGSSAYLGDPSALVTLYTKQGMYAEACDVVTKILSGINRHEAGSELRENQAASRLPERGDVDYVPYKKIDILWHLIDMVQKRNAGKKSELDRIVSSRNKMEVALEKHFTMMKVSELGMRSARALHQGSRT